MIKYVQNKLDSSISNKIPCMDVHCVNPNKRVKYIYSTVRWFFTIFCFYLTVLTLFKTTTATDDQSYNKILRIRQTARDYIKFKPNMEPFSDSITVCAWVWKSRSGDARYRFSYATTSNNNALT